MDLINSIIYQTIVYAAPIILATLGGLLAYRINIVNIGLEGFMIFSALGAALAIYFTQSYLVGLLVCLISSILIGLLYSLFSITLKANFIITGFAINLLAAALATYIIRSMGLTQIDLSVISLTSLVVNIPLIKDIPILGSLLSGHTIMVYLTVIVYFITVIFLNKIPIGTHLKVIGENEAAALSVGIKVNKVKYLTLILSALIVGLGGFIIATEQVRLYTSNVIAGTGFIAIAAFYCGNGRPLLSTIYALIFGFTKAISFTLAFGNTTLEGILRIIPYLSIIIVLTIVSLIKIKNKIERKVNYDG